MSRHRVPATPLEQSPAARGYPRSAKGEYGEWQNGSFFSTRQQEWHKLSGRHAGIDAQFGIIELETGEWLADGWIWGARYPDRQAALVAAAGTCIEKATHAATSYTNGRTFAPRLTISQANAVIEWAADKAGIPAPLMVEPPPRQAPAPSPAVVPGQLNLFGA